MALTYIFDRESTGSAANRGILRPDKYKDKDYQKRTGQTAEKYAEELTRQGITFKRDLALLSSLPDLTELTPCIRMLHDGEEFVHVFEF